MFDLALQARPMIIADGKLADWPTVAYGRENISTPQTPVLAPGGGGVSSIGGWRKDYPLQARN